VCSIYLKGKKEKEEKRRVDESAGEYHHTLSSLSVCVCVPLIRRENGGNIYKKSALGLSLVYIRAESI
jgi:hypothetical protein